MFIDKGRSIEERSCIVIENGRFYGMGYIDLYGQYADLADIRTKVKVYPSNHYMMELVRQMAERYPNKVHFLTQNPAGLIAAEPDTDYDKIATDNLFQ
ncbi:hypothetical protein D3C81_628620 [compost metagenome]